MAVMVIGSAARETAERGDHVFCPHMRATTLGEAAMAAALMMPLAVSQAYD